MIKPTTKHTDVIIRAQKLFENAMNSAVEPKFKRALQRDIKLLTQVRGILYRVIDCPTLPFIVSAEPPVQPILDQIEQEPNGAF